MIFRRRRHGIGGMGELQGVAMMKPTERDFESFCKAAFKFGSGPKTVLVFTEDGLVPADQLPPDHEFFRSIRKFARQSDIDIANRAVKREFGR